MKLPGNILLLFSGFAVTNILLALENLLLARIYGAESFGVIAYVTGGMTLFVTLMDFGTSTHLTKKLSILAGMQKAPISRVAGTSLAAVIFQALLAAVCFYIWFNYFPPAITRHLRPVFSLWCGIGIFFLFFQRFFGAFFDGRKKMAVSGLIFTITGLIRFAAVLVALWQKAPIETLFLFIAVAYILSGVAAWSIFHTHLHSRKIRIHLQIRPSLKFIKQSLPFYLPYIGPIVLLPVFIVLIGMFLSKKDVAYFSVCWSLSSLAFLLLFPVARALFPYINNAVTKKLDGEVKVLTDAIFQFTSLAGMAVFLFACMFGKFVLSLYGKGFDESHSILVLLSLAVFFELYRFPSNILLHSTPHVSITTKGELIKFLATLPSAFLLIPIFEVTGAALAMLLGYVSGNFFKLRIIQKHYYFPPVHFFVRVGLIICVIYMIYLLSWPLTAYISVIMLILLLRLFSSSSIRTTISRLSLIE